MRGLALVVSVLLFITVLRLAAHSDFYDETIEENECKCDCGSDFKSDETPECSPEESEEDQEPQWIQYPNYPHDEYRPS